jgi:hypothetical protein
VAWGLCEKLTAAQRENQHVKYSPEPWTFSDYTELLHVFTHLLIKVIFEVMVVCSFLFSPIVILFSCN